jgi:hypothetical protein
MHIIRECFPIPITSKTVLENNAGAKLPEKPERIEDLRIERLRDYRVFQLLWETRPAGPEGMTVTGVYPLSSTRVARFVNV